MKSLEGDKSPDPYEKLMMKESSITTSHPRSPSPSMTLAKFMDKYQIAQPDLNNMSMQKQVLAFCSEDQAYLKYKSGKFFAD